ncbi:MAG TPA: 4Fe-4S binding protein [Methylomirabilota bacterium]|jgi:NAD-dependent dihydropyrimidine dehydrogenase PreA subunit|nr:4Fe-4S binding protein [Methylomirabilota bacterium]
MAYVIAEPCIGVKDASCLAACPVNCIYRADEQLYINPDECIDCGACDPVCPVNAIFPEGELPKKWRPYVDKNAAFFGIQRRRRPGAVSGG